jgi:hypothetical protein
VTSGFTPATTRVPHSNTASPAFKHTELRFRAHTAARVSAPVSLAPSPRESRVRPLRVAVSCTQTSCPHPPSYPQARSTRVPRSVGASRLARRDAPGNGWGLARAHRRMVACSGAASGTFAVTLHAVRGIFAAFNVPRGTLATSPTSRRAPSGPGRQHDSAGALGNGWELQLRAGAANRRNSVGAGRAAGGGA